MSLLRAGRESFPSLLVLHRYTLTEIFLLGLLFPEYRLHGLASYSPMTFLSSPWKLSCLLSLALTCALAACREIARCAKNCLRCRMMVASESSCCLCAR